MLPCPGDGDSDANAPSPHHLCLSMKGKSVENIEKLQCSVIKLVFLYIKASGYLD